MRFGSRLFAIISALFTFAAFCGSSVAATLTLQWEPSEDSHAIGYRIHLIKESQILPPIDIGLTNQYELSGLDPAARYLIFLTARDAAGFESDASDVVQYPETAPCLAQITLADSALPSDRTDGFFIVASSSACYTPPLSDSSWLSFGDPVPIGGRALVSFSAQSNRSEDIRSALVSVGQTRFTILQAAGRPTPPLVIRSLPRFPIAADEGTQLDLAVEIEPEPNLRLQWFKNNNPLPNATNNIFSILEVVPEDAGSYSVSITNDIGSVQQGPVTVSVNERPKILRQPSDLLVKMGDFAIFTVTASGTDLHYLWIFNGSLFPIDAPQILFGPVKQQDFGLIQVIVSNQVAVVQSRPFYLKSVEFEQQLGRVNVSLLPEGTLQVRGEGVPGVGYDILISRDLVEWSTFGAVVVSDSGTFSIESPLPADDPYGRWFVRLLRQSFPP